MGIEEEIRLYKQLTDNVAIAINETYDSIFTCEENIDKLLKLAPCVFNKDEFFELLTARNELYLRIGRFERLATKIAGMPMITNTMDVLEVQAVIMHLNESFEQLSSYVDKFNIRFQSDQFDVDKFIFIQKVDALQLDFDVVDYDELYDYFSDKANMFYILQVKDYLNEGFDSLYGNDTNVLSIKPFKTRVDANVYALRNGISRDFIYTKF